jgi:hypothetical protein
MNENKKLARTAGLLYLFVIIFGIFAELFARSKLIVAGDLAATTTNITSNMTLFRIGFVSDLLMIISFLLLPLAFYLLLNKVNKNVALLMVIFVLVSVPIMFVNMIFYYALSLNAPIYFFELYTVGVMIATMFHGLWLLPLGYLVYKSGYFPKIFGVFLMIACFGFLIESFVFFFSGPEIITYPGMIFEIIGEFGFCAWLLIKGAKISK